METPLPPDGRINGIVIRSHASRESDAVLRVLTAEAGKISIYARGARASKRRFGSSIELFDRGEMKVRIGRGSMAELESFQPRAALRSLREDFDKLAAASLLCECVDLIVKEEQAHAGEQEQIYTDVDLALQAIEESASLIDTCRATFFALSSVLSRSGFLEHDSARKPSAKNLLHLIRITEECAEKQVASKEAFVSVLKQLGKPTAANA
ncbi:MAG: DNA repair protein RecO [Deltaproteobacteria bacterium]|nr:DNA repair protein RecO [Deltaproteobacteria bacterium]